MQEPDTRVVSVEANHEVATKTLLNIEWHDGRVTTRRVLQVKSNAAAPETSALGKDEEVVTVKMDRVWKRDWRLHNNVDPLAERRCLDSKIAGVSWDGAVLLDAVERRVAPLRLEGIRSSLVAREEPLVQIRGLAVGLDDDVLKDFLVLATCIPLDDGHKVRQGLINALWLVGVGRRGWVGGGGANIVHNGLDIFTVSDVVANGLVVGTHPVVVNCLVGFQNDIVPLAGVDIENGGLVRRDWHEVGLDDGERMAIDVELESRRDGGIEDTKAVFLASNNIHGPSLAAGETREGVLAVDETVVQSGSFARSSSCHNLGCGVELVGCRVAPILEGDELLLIIGAVV